MDRKEFFKKTCVSSACLCGFAGITLDSNASSYAGKDSAIQDEKLALVKEWISSMLSNLGDQSDTEATRNTLKKCAITHYNNLNMDGMLADYIGDLEKFITFIQEKWGWKIDYNKAAKTLIADENKNYCVCPIVDHSKVMKIPAICYCSEGFAEKMFSKVLGSPVTATVISSIQRGDKSCKYKIEIV